MLQSLGNSTMDKSLVCCGSKERQTTTEGEHANLHCLGVKSRRPNIHPSVNLLLLYYRSSSQQPSGEGTMDKSLVYRRSSQKDKQPLTPKTQFNFGLREETGEPREKNTRRQIRRRTCKLRTQRFEPATFLLRVDLRTT